MAFLISTALSTLLEIDEVQHEPFPDGRLKTVFITTGVVEDLAALKTRIWALFSPPVQRVESIDIQILQAGPIAKRYRITVVTRPLL